ncbi:MAG: hypothetical protein RLT87_07635 [Gammaproteobacteria bacterium]
MQKEFGKLSSKQALNFYNYFISSLEDAFSDLDVIKKKDLATTTFPPWYKLYEYDYNQLVAYFLISMDFGDKVKEFASSQDPQQELLHYISTDPDPIGDISKFDNQQLTNFICSFYANVMCLASMGTYNKTMNQLVKESESNDKSLFQAITIDRTAINTEVASRRLAKAMIEQDEQFFDHLAKAIKGNYPKRPPEKYDELRFMMALLEDAASSDNLDKDALYQLCVNELDLYPDASQSEDSRGSFERYVNRMRKKSRT